MSLRPRSPTTLLAAATALLVSTGASTAAEPSHEMPEYRIPRLDLEVTIDGVLDEPAWQQALVFELSWETDPGENVDPAVRTECRMFYDRRHLYYGCHAFDPEPETIRARFRDRDAAAFSDDLLGLSIDPFDSQNRSFVLDVNPLGVQNDRLYREAEGFSDESWDAVWQSAGRIVEDGWVVEVAIPFSSLRFSRSPGEQTWAFNFRRYRPREVRRRMAIVPYDRADPCRLCQSAKLVGFEGIDAGRNLEVTPTLTGSQQGTQEDYPDGELDRDDPDLDLGVTVRWGVTPNLSLNAAVNPDFSQVEADVAQLDVNNQFALFFPERRPFFLEGIDFFSTPVNAVYTRSVADPIGGLKVSGKQGRNGLGVFVAQDEQTNLLFPGVEGSSLGEYDEETTDTVLRYRRDLWQSSTLGALFTDRRGGDYFNRVAGIDARLRLGSTDNLDVQLLGSESRYPDELAVEEGQPLGKIDGHGILANWRHRTRDWTLSVQYDDFADDFRADLGFVPQVGYRRLSSEGGYRWYGDADHWYTQLGVSGGIGHSENRDGGLLQDNVYAFVSYDGPLQSGLYLGGEVSDRTYTGVAFDGLNYFFGGGSIRPSRNLVFGLEFGFGDTIDFSEARPADTVRLSPVFAFGLGRHLSGSLSHNFQSLDVEGGQLFEANLSELRVVYQFNLRALLRLISQYETVDRNPDLYSDEVDASTRTLFSQLLFSYKLDPQTALYVGATGNWLDENDSGLVRTDETLFFKVGYQWRP